MSIESIERTLIACAIALSAAAAAADGLVPYENSWRLSFVKNGKSKEAGTVTDQVVAVDVDGRHLLKRIQIVKYDTVKFETRNENVFDPVTMAPVSMDFWRNGPLVNHREFDGRFVYFHTPGTPIKIAEYPKAVVDFYGGMYGLLLAGLPLQEGYTTTLAAVDEDDATYREVPIRVLKREPVAAGRLGTVDAWLTEAKTSMGAMRFWISKSPPYILKLEWDAPSGVLATYVM